MPYHNRCPLRVVDARGCQKGHLKAYPSHSGKKGLTFFMARNSSIFLGATLLMNDISYKLNNFSYYFSSHEVVWRLL